MTRPPPPPVVCSACRRRFWPAPDCPAAEAAGVACEAEVCPVRGGPAWVWFRTDTEADKFLARWHELVMAAPPPRAVRRRSKDADMYTPEEA